MPVRAVLNVVYAMAVESMDAKERREFDEQLYGWTGEQDAANKVLWGQSGGES